MPSLRGSSDDPRYNKEGYYDPTAYIAMKNIEAAERAEKYEEDRFKKLLWVIKDICKLAGFEIEGRIALKDLSTGKVWR